MQNIPDYKQYPKEAYELLHSLAVIPAPSGMEDQRVDFCLQWLEANGVKGAFTDAAKNLIIPLGDNGQNPLIVFSAHSDVVFPDRTPLPWLDDGTLIHCPGIADNTVHAVALLWAAKILSAADLPASAKDTNVSASAKNTILPASAKDTGLPASAKDTGLPASAKDTVPDAQPQTGLLLVINSCEEGLGNLKGSRQLLADYGHRIQSFVAFDSIYEEIVTRPIGSRRYSIRVTTEGGHSFRDFGKDNAIAILADIIHDLYQLELPREGKTTFNVGTIQGGTSVNTIAQSAEMLFEFRSDTGSSLQYMEDQLRKILSAHPGQIDCQTIGDRPCMGEVDPARQQQLIDQAETLLRRHYPEEPVLTYGSTDCNIPLSMGIPAVCLGCCRGHGAHTREEYLRKDSLAPGLNLALDFIFTTAGLTRESR